MTDETLEQTLKRHFPDAEISDTQHLFTHELLEEPYFAKAINPEVEEEHLAGLASALKNARKHLNALHPQVMRELQSQFATNTLERLKFAPGISLANPRGASGLHTSLISLIYSLEGRAEGHDLQRQPSALKAAKTKIAELHHTNPAQRRELTHEKIKIVDHAIGLFRKYGEREPQLLSDGFLSLLNDLLPFVAPKHALRWQARQMVIAYKKWREL